MLKRYFFFLVITLVWKPLHAQNYKFSNSVHLTGGTFILGSQGFLHFEKLQERKVLHTFIQGGLGGGNMALFSGGSTLIFTFVGRTGLLTGKGSHHFEASVGACLIRNSENFIPAPALNIGYRYHHPDAHPIIRFGIGVPEGIYLGIGWRY